MRRILAILISILPVNALRIFAYRTLFGYRISASRVGWGTVICVKKAEIMRSNIGKFNRFLGPMNLVIKEEASIGSSNIFLCGDWTMEERFRNADYQRYLEIGESTRISDNHYFDVAGSFVLGKNSWIAGRTSQFWTHGADIADRNIRIGENCYIGSAVKFAPGAQIGNHVLVGIGSVVTKKIKNDNVLICGVPAVIKKENYDWKGKIS